MTDSSNGAMQSVEHTPAPQTVLPVMDVPGPRLLGFARIIDLVGEANRKLFLGATIGGVFAAALLIYLAVHDGRMSTGEAVFLGFLFAAPCLILGWCAWVLDREAALHERLSALATLVDLASSNSKPRFRLRELIGLRKLVLQMASGEGDRRELGALLQRPLLFIHPIFAISVFGSVAAIGAMGGASVVWGLYHFFG